jgi:hypothetical protein
MLSPAGFCRLPDAVALAYIIIIIIYCNGKQCSRKYVTKAKNNDKIKRLSISPAKWNTYIRSTTSRHSRLWPLFALGCSLLSRSSSSLLQRRQLLSSCRDHAVRTRLTVGQFGASWSGTSMASVHRELSTVCKQTF